MESERDMLATDEAVAQGLGSVTGGRSEQATHTALGRVRERLDTALEDLAECKRRLAKYDELFDVDMLRALKAFKNQNSPRKWRAETRMEKA